MSQRLQRAFMKMPKQRVRARKDATVLIGNQGVRTQVVNVKGQWKHIHQDRHRTLEDPLYPGQKRRKQESSFNILIQTNKKPKPDDFGERDTMSQALVTIARRLATDPVLWSTFFVFGPKHPEYGRDSEFPAEVIERILLNHGSNVLAPEMGDKAKRLHIHFLYTVQHYSEIQIDFKRAPYLIADMWNDEMRKAGKTHLEFKPGQKPFCCMNLIPEMGAQKFITAYNTKELQKPEALRSRKLGTKKRRKGRCKDLPMPKGRRRQVYQ